MKIRKHLVVVAAVFLAGSIAFAMPAVAQNASKKANMKEHMHHMMGMVSSMTESNLTLMHKHMLKDVHTTFMLDAKTQKEGTIEKGSHVVVYYKMENHHNVATKIMAAPAKKK